MESSMSHFIIPGNCDGYICWGQGCLKPELIWCHSVYIGYTAPKQRLIFIDQQITVLERTFYPRLANTL